MALQAPPASQEVTLRGFWDNDGAVHDITDGYDRHYTNGFGFALFWQPVGLSEESAEREVSLGMTVGQIMQTPRDLESTLPVAGDMPYAGYLYFGGIVQWSGICPDAPGIACMDHVQLDMGVIGPSSHADDLQIWVHNSIVGEDPLGWDNQLEDRMMAQLTLRRKWRVSPGEFDGFGWDLIPEVMGGVGTVTQRMEAGAVVRAGWHLPEDFGPSTLADPGTVHASTSGRFLYFHAGVKAKRVWADTLVEGYDHGDETGISLEKWQASLTVGVTWRRQWDDLFTEFGYSMTWHTSRFDVHEGTDSWGSIMVSAGCTW